MQVFGDILADHVIEIASKQPADMCLNRKGLMMLAAVRITVGRTSPVCLASAPPPCHCAFAFGSKALHTDLLLVTSPATRCHDSGTFGEPESHSGGSVGEQTVSHVAS